MRVNVSYQQIPPSKAFNYYINEGVEQYQHLLGNDGRMDWIISESSESKISKIHYKSGKIDVHAEGKAPSYHQAVSKAMKHLLRRIKKQKECSKNHIKNKGNLNWL